MTLMPTKRVILLQTTALPLLHPNQSLPPCLQLVDELQEASEFA